MPVTSVEWVGDMSAPSVLPQSGPSQSLETCPVTEALMKQVSDIDDLSLPNAVEDYDTAECLELHNIMTPLKPSVSFSNNIEPPPRSHNVAVFTSIARDTPSYNRQAGRRQTPNMLVRSRAEAATHNLAVFTLKPSLMSLDPSRRQNSSAQSTRRRPQDRQALGTKWHRARCCEASRASSRSSRESRSSDRDFFTPPSTCYPSTRANNDKGECPGKNTSPPIVRSAVRSPGIRSASSIDNPMVFGKSNEALPRAARSIGGSVPAMVGRYQLSNSFSLLHSQPESSAVRNTQQDLTGEHQSDTQRRKLTGISPTPQAEASSHDFSSSLFTRRKCRWYRNRSKTLDGGADAATPQLQSTGSTPRKSFSFDNGLHAVEALAEQRYKAAKGGVWTSSKREEISRLRDDNASLKKQISVLRNEFQGLKNVLLQAESHRRWAECLS